MKDGMICQAYGVWLQGGTGKDWIQYLHHLGLIPKSRMTEKKKKILSNRGHEIAAKIMKMDRPRKIKKALPRVLKNEKNIRTRR
jgi:hypothetical protein